ncbi:fibronectin type III domain-containing protein [Streptomyces noboritoensis]|uniref:Fibronectin type III domain-containing protein n=1 Tax=Streptomyces noboritoensis TaxID=67337 RepID=A0ABV6TEQ3_9ACTN
MSENKPGIIAKAQWLSGNEHSARFQVRLTNYGAEAVYNPTISMGFHERLTITGHYGLMFAPADRPVSTVSGTLVLEKRLIEPGTFQEFTLSVQNGGAGAGSDPVLLPYTFSVNGSSANPPREFEPPTVPQDLRVTGTGAGVLTLEWDAATDNSGIAEYIVAYTSDWDGPELTVTTLAPKVTLNRLAPATEYVVRVRAADFAGNLSRWSDPVAAATTDALQDAGDWDVPRAPFVDYTAYPTPSIAEYARGSGVDGFLVGFLNTRPGGDKTLSWGGYQGDGDATTGDFGKEDFTAFTKNGGTPILSFGGASNAPLETSETDIAGIVAQYQGVIDNYQTKHLDFAFEGAILGDDAAQDRHTAAIGQLLQDNPGLKLSYTLPADGAPGSLVGFPPAAERLLNRLADAGIQPSLLNGLLMEFGQSAPADAFECCRIALDGMFTQVQAIWPQWSRQQVWRRIGATPMFGRNMNGKVFTLENMRQLAAFATEHQLGCLSGWDATRDHNQGTLPECSLSSNHPDLVRCTAVEQQPYDFAKIIARYRK